MSPRFLKQMIEATPRQSDLPSKTSFEEQTFMNALFKVEFYQRTPNYNAVLELKLSPPMD